MSRFQVAHTSLINPKTKLSGWLIELRRILIGIVLLLSSSLASSQDIVVDAENKVAINRIKTAYLYNFLKYIEIKAPHLELNELNAANDDVENQQAVNPKADSLSMIQSSLSYYLVCVLGDDPFAEILGFDPVAWLVISR